MCCCFLLRMQYKEDLELDYLKRQKPSAPPDGVHDSAVALYHEIVQRFKRLEEMILLRMSVA